jgi:response regulator RpfG family c-di-GMP phosphodiesterase
MNQAALPGMPVMHEKVLMVDDEINVLEGYQRLFRHEFQIDTAAGGAAALTALAATGPYAVVVSDMRMPEMDGAKLLTKIKQLAPETTRIMLTGNSDIHSAVSAVNEGSIFRFLTKPCSRENLGKALTAGLAQYRLVTAEKGLLEHTLQGSIQVLTEVLSLVNPAAFGRALRLRRYIHQAVTRMALESPWRFEVAAMLSQLGCVTLHPETIEAVYAGRPLPPDEQARFDAHPGVAHDLLSKIPRMEPIAWMIAHQNDSVLSTGSAANGETADMRMGANLLRATMAFDELVRKGVSESEAANRLSQEYRDFDPRILQALVESEAEKDQTELHTCTLDQLSPFGMALAEELRTTTGVLLVAKGQEVTAALILKLRSFLEKGAIGHTVVISSQSNRAKGTSA